jgi:hypothetical protein
MVWGPDRERTVSALTDTPDSPQPLWPDRPAPPNQPPPPAPPAQAAPPATPPPAVPPAPPGQPGQQARAGQPVQPLWPSQPGDPSQPGGPGWSVPGAGAWPAARGRSAAWPVWSPIGPALGALLGVGLVTATLAAGPTIRLDLHLTSVTAMLTVVAYLLPAVGGAAVGLLVGRRWPAAVVAPAMAVMLVGAVAVALAPAVFVVLAGQVMAGLGAGAAAGTAVGLLPLLGSRRQQATLVLAGAAVLCLPVGFVIGFAVTRFVEWRWTFFLVVPVALVAGAITLVGGIMRMVNAQAR